MSIHNMCSWGNKKNINIFTFGKKTKNILSRAMLNPITGQAGITHCVLIAIASKELLPYFSVQPTLVHNLHVLLEGGMLTPTELSMHLIGSSNCQLHGS